MLIEIIGDMFDYEHEAYAHGVNTLGVMNAGIAVRFREMYPRMFTEYGRRCRMRELLPGGCYEYVAPDGIVIFNLATQDSLEHATALYLEDSVRRMFNYAYEHDIINIAMPRIGCGLGGLSLDALYKALKPFIQDTKFSVTLYSLD